MSTTPDSSGFRVFDGYRTLPAPGAATALGETVVTLGNFDGVHLGHQALMAHIARRAAETGRKSVVYTFEPHPVRILNPKLAPPRITPRDEKLRLIGALGINAAVVEPFDLAFAATSPDDFVAKALVAALGVKELVIGYDFTYGKAGAGNTASLAAAAERFGFTLSVISQQTFGGMVASSTKVRELVLGGNVEGARVLLGRHYSVAGPVAHGFKRGRSIGFPTANIDTANELIPRYGVYACRVSFADEPSRVFDAVTNVGVRPTVSTGDPRPTVEAHLFDTDADLYGRAARVEFVTALREERKFASIDALKAQIAVDADHARKALAAQR